MQARGSLSLATRSDRCDSSPPASENEHVLMHSHNHLPNQKPLPAAPDSIAKVQPGVATAVQPGINTVLQIAFYS